MIANICGSIFFISLGGLIGCTFTVWTFGVKQVREDKRNYELTIMAVVCGCGMFWLATKLGLIW